MKKSFGVAKIKNIYEHLALAKIKNIYEHLAYVFIPYDHCPFLADEPDPKIYLQFCQII